MRDDDNESLAEDYGEEEYENGFLRWMSVIVVLVAVAGFFALAYYAYHTGTQSINEDDVTLVQADSAPVKEAPADPGGMQVPHQDKTVYDVMADKNETKPTAERILPEPEEPVSLKSTGQTETWVNNALHSAAQDATKETVGSSTAPSTSGHVVQDVQMVPSDSTTAAATATTTPETSVAYEPAQERVDPKIIKVDPEDKKTSEAASNVVSVIAVNNEDKAASAAIASAKPEGKPDTTEKTAKAEKAKTEEKKVASATPSAGKPAGKVKVQLGAFKSEDEADATWKKIFKSNGELIGSRDHVIQRADLGEKGVYYRLQLVGLDAAGAKNLCDKLTARKQGCFIVK